MPLSPVFSRMREDIDTGVAMCRERCEYFSVCGGGEPVNKLAENGSFATTETVYCRLTKMRATDLVLDALDRVPEERVPGECVPGDGDSLAALGPRAPPGEDRGPAEHAGISG